MSGARSYIAGAAFVISAAAFAAEADRWPSFRQADQDANGALTLDEVRDVRVLANDFALYDKNGDGKLSRAEFEAAKRGVTTENAGRATGAGARR